MKGKPLRKHDTNGQADEGRGRIPPPVSAPVRRAPKLAARRISDAKRNAQARPEIAFKTDTGLVDAAENDLGRVGIRLQLFLLVLCFMEGQLSSGMEA